MRWTTAQNWDAHAEAVPPATGAYVVTLYTGFGKLVGVVLYRNKGERIGNGAELLRTPNEKEAVDLYYSHARMIYKGDTS